MVGEFFSFLGLVYLLCEDFQTFLLDSMILRAEIPRVSLQKK